MLSYAARKTKFVILVIVLLDEINVDRRLEFKKRVPERCCASVSIVNLLDSVIMYITPTDLLKRYTAGERNFAGVRFFANTDRTDVLRKADLSNIILSGAYLASVNLVRANLRGAQMVGAYLFRASLTEANLIDADLTGANLVRASLYNANLTRAKLFGATLLETRLGGAELTDARFDDSILFRVNLSRIKLTEGRPRGIICPCAFIWETTMPDGQFEAGFRFYET